MPSCRLIARAAVGRAPLAQLACTLVLALGCGAPTTVRVDFSAPPLASVSLQVTLGTGAHVERGPVALAGATSGSFLVVLPDQSTDVTVSVSGVEVSGPTTTATAMARSQPHEQTPLSLTLLPVGVDGGAPLDGGADGGSERYRAAVLADAPVAYWPLDEASGATAHDVTGHGHDGIYGSAVQLGAPGLVPNAGGVAAHFPGGPPSLARVVSIAEARALQPATVTIEAWVRLDPGVSTAGFPAILSSGSNSEPGFQYALQLGPTSALDGWVVTQLPDGGLKGHETVGGAQLGTGAHHVGLVYDRGHCTLYVDGRADVAAPVTGDIAGYSSVLGIVIGGDVDGPRNAIAATIAHVALYDHAVAAATLAAHYQAGMP